MTRSGIYKNICVRQFYIYQKLRTDICTQTSDTLDFSSFDFDGRVQRWWSSSHSSSIPTIDNPFNWYSAQEGTIARAIYLPYLTPTGYTNINGTIMNIDIVVMWIGIPRFHLLYFWLAAGFFSLKTYMVSVCIISVLVNISQFLCFHLFPTTPNRRGTQSHVEKWSDLVPSSHLDPIGDQTDVNNCQYMAYILHIW